MPIYGYRCEKCDLEFEVMQKVSDPTLSTHEVCGGELHRVYFPVGVIFKGSGFYSTDNRKSGKKPAATGEAKPGSPEAKSGEGSASGGGEGAGGGESGGAAAESGSSAGSETGKSVSGETPDTGKKA